MGYASKLEGILSLHPFPAPEAVPALREALLALATPNGGRLVLSPLGHGVVLESTFDWTAALEMIERTLATVFSPAGLVAAGSLRAIGEDDALLATLTIDAGGVRVERHESEHHEGEGAGDPDEGDDKEAEWARFRELAREQGLAPHLETLERLCVPSLRLRPRKRSKLKSRLGGLPDVPTGFAWPVGSTGEPLVFVAQIDLAEVHAAELPGAAALPERGMLAFFHGHEPSPDGEHLGNAGRVLFFDGSAPLARARAGKGHVALPSIPIAFELQTEELPSLESPHYALMLAEAGAGDPDGAAFDVFGDFVAEYGQRGVRDEDERPVHRLLGYADPLQSDVNLDTEGHATKLPFSAWRTLDHHRAAARWRLLLQVDSDAARDVLFGDGGVLAFMIREEDLAERRFDRVWVDWQSH